MSGPMSGRCPLLTERVRRCAVRMGRHRDIADQLDPAQLDRLDARVLDEEHLSRVLLPMDPADRSVARRRLDQVGQQWW